MQSNGEIQLTGCTAEPLMNYLKAVGVLRLVVEQKDQQAKGCWRDGVFVLKSVLDEQALMDFIVHDYQPSPIFAPWNGDGGFLTDSGASLDTINRLRGISEVRLQPLRLTVSKIDQVPVLNKFKKARETEKALNKKKQQQKKLFSKSDADALLAAKQEVKEIKQTILFDVRATFPDEVVKWLDACLSISSEGFVTAPLLGSGGCDGRLEFSTNFLDNVLTFFTLQPENMQQWVERAIFARGETKLVATSIGQFSPGQIGGPNATQGFEGKSLINPLDFVLMVEGAILFAGSVVRKLEIAGTAKGAFPFTVFSSSVGHSMDAAKDSKTARGEIWVPLWRRFAGLKEVAQVLAEGRAEVNGRQASSGVQLARAVASLGVDRGINGFVRYGFLQRNGKAYLATELGRFDVLVRTDVDLLKEADAWLDRYRGAASSDKVPPRFRSALRRIETAIFAFCEFGGTARFAEILCAFGNAERQLAMGEKFRKDKQIKPLPRLSPEWIWAADDNSMEFRLARALAGIYDSEKKVEPIRSNFEPVLFGKWKEGGFCDVWNSASLSNNLLSVLERRLMDAEKLGCQGLPLASRHKATINAIATFIAGDVDDGRIEELLWGMILVDHHKPLENRSPLYIAEEGQGEGGNESLMPRPYALLKLLFLPNGLNVGDIKIIARPEPAITALLRAGRTKEACAIAARRLKASGLTPMTYRRGGKILNEADWQAHGVEPMRLGAALLFPILDQDINQLKQMVIRPNNKGLL